MHRVFRYINGEKDELGYEILCPYGDKPCNRFVTPPDKDATNVKLKFFIDMSIEEWYDFGG